ncbi:MAG: U32 family peptidase [Proteobacteria bacterium]|nr:U32 family peptidase [Pseudomonadota bacterium]MBU1711475.1 U32 family peptidase [Pseudomonadota bacterium]
MDKRPNSKIELLAPAGNREKLEIAIHYGADAVYLAGKDYSLRNLSENFTLEELESAVLFARKSGVKVYVACNIFSRNSEQEAISDYLKSLAEISPDAVIVADPGILLEVRKVIPDIPVHLSTQANTTNYKAALFWKHLGVTRINAARELSLKEIEEIALLGNVEVEIFVHGAMCISYSGRCLLSNFMENRDSNRGECCQPCRFRYSVVEETRPGRYMPVAEDNRGTYIFNSKDLCMIRYIPEMINTGASSLKIEGRMKGINYVASAVKVYREAIDSYYESPAEYTVKDEWIDELSRISNRDYCTGFYFGNTNETIPNYMDIKPATERTFIGKVTGVENGNVVVFVVRNKFFLNDPVDILGKKGPVKRDTIKRILDIEGNEVTAARSGSTVKVLLENECSVNDLLRKIEE